MVALTDFKQVFIQQRYEVGEFLGFETRNKYQVLDAKEVPIAFAAEQQKGFLGWVARQFLGHWRTFDIHFFNNARQEIMVAHHPFRLFFQRLEVSDMDGNHLGALQQRFSILTKRFDVQNAEGLTIMEVASPIWKIWAFPFMWEDKELARISKKWSGGFAELFTDKDNFMVEFNADDLTESERQLILAASVFIDLQYFETKSSNN